MALSKEDGNGVGIRCCRNSIPRNGRPKTDVREVEKRKRGASPLQATHLFYAFYILINNV